MLAQHMDLRCPQQRGWMVSVVCDLRVFCDWCLYFVEQYEKLEAGVQIDWARILSKTTVQSVAGAAF